MLSTYSTGFRYCPNCTTRLYGPIGLVSLWTAPPVLLVGDSVFLSTGICFHPVQCLTPSRQLVNTTCTEGLWQHRAIREAHESGATMKRTVGIGERGSKGQPHPVHGRASTAAYSKAVSLCCTCVRRDSTTTDNRSSSSAQFELIFSIFSYFLSWGAFFISLAVGLCLRRVEHA